MIALQEEVSLQGADTGFFKREVNKYFQSLKKLQRWESGGEVEPFLSFSLQKGPQNDGKNL